MLAKGFAPIQSHRAHRFCWHEIVWIGVTHGIPTEIEHLTATASRASAGPSDSLQKVTDSNGVTPSMIRFNPKTERTKQETNRGSMPSNVSCAWCPMALWQLRYVHMTVHWIQLIHWPSHDTHDTRVPSQAPVTCYKTSSREPHQGAIVHQTWR